MKTHLSGRVFRIDNEAGFGYPDGWYFKDNHMCYNGPFDTAEAAAQAYDRTLLEGAR